MFDITGWNANVTLELGIAVGLGKKYFILFNSAFEKARDVPSDIQGLERIQYRSNSELEARIRILLKQELKLRATQTESAFDVLKRRIIDYLAETPGRSIAEVSESIAEEKTLVSSTIKAMVANEELRTEGQKRGTRYYIKDLDVTTSIQDSVLKVIKKAAGLGLGAIAERSRLAKDTVRNALRILQRDQKVKIYGQRRNAVYVIADFDLRTLRAKKAKKS